MCRYCDYNSSDCCIYQDGLTDEWYLDIQTGEWDSYDDGYIHQREYIEFCPYCGKNLKYNQERFKWIKDEEQRPKISGYYLTLGGSVYEVRYFNKDRGWLYMFHPAKKVEYWAKIPQTDDRLEIKYKINKLRTNNYDIEELKKCINNIANKEVGNETN